MEAGRWQFLGLSHSSKGKSCRLTVFLDGEGKRHIVDYPKFPKKSRYLEQTFFPNLPCSSSSVLISEAPTNPDKIYEVSKRLPHGVCRPSDIATLAELHVGKAASAWTPLRTLQGNVYSVLKHNQKVHAALKGSSGVHVAARRSIYCDRMSNVVPLFYVVALVDAALGRKLLGNLLQVCRVYLEKSSAYPVPEIRFAREIKCFARSFGINLLHYDPSLMNGDLIKQIGEIACICPRLKRKVLKMFMATVNYWVNIQCDIFFWEVIKACIISNVHSYSDIINTNILIDIMESINNPSCCSVHCIEENSKNLDAKYDSMKYLLKLFIASDLETGGQSLSRILYALSNKPCPCLYGSLVKALKEAAKVDLNCVITLHKMHAMGTILNGAKDYPVDVKVVCLSLAAVALKQSGDESVYTSELKNPLLALVGAPVKQRSSKSIRAYGPPTRKLRPMISSSSTSLNKILEFGIPERRNRVESLVKGAREVTRRNSGVCLGASNSGLSANKDGSKRLSRALTSKLYDKETKENPFEMPAERQNMPSSSGVIKNPFLVASSTQETIDEVPESNVEALYAAVVFWATGTSPELALVWKPDQPVVIPENRPVVKNPQMLPLLLALVKAADSRATVERYLRDLTTLAKASAENVEAIKNTEGFVEWLVELETQCYSEALNCSEKDFDVAMMQLAFELHLALLAALVSQQKGVKYVLDYFISSVYKVHFANAAGSRERNIAWSCLKYLWAELIRGIEELRTISIFTEITVYLVLCHYLGKDREVDIEDYNNSFNDDLLNPLASFRVSGMEVINRVVDRLLQLSKAQEQAADLVGLREMCEEQVLDENLKVLENKVDKELQFIHKEQGYTSFSIILFDLGLSNSTSAGICSWLTKLKTIAFHICLLMEYAAKKGCSKVVKSETKNLLLVITVLVHKYNADKGNQRQVNKALCNVLMYVLRAAEELKGEVKDFVKKILCIDEALIPKIFLSAKNCVDANGDTRIFNPTLLSNASERMAKAFERLSFPAFDMLRSEFKRVAELVVKRREILQKGSGGFRLSLRLPGILGRFSSSQCEESPEIFRDESIARLLKNQAKISKWTRKWVKTLKFQKEWQGAWRDRSIFDDPSQFSKMPLTLATHTFANGARCLMKLRPKRTKCLPAESLPKTSVDLLNSHFFALISGICIEENSSWNFTAKNNNEQLLWGYDYSLLKEKSLSQVLYEEIPSGIRKQLVEPMECEIYTPLYAKKGKILICYKEANGEYYIKLVLSKDIVMTEDKRLMFTFEYQPQLKQVKQWKVRSIKVIYKKYIVDQKSAMEVLFYTGKCVLFNFASESDRNKFCSRILGIKGVKIECYPKGGKHQLKDLMNAWTNWKISNFDYLMALNNFSGRSFSNVSQYPVFPWVIDDVKSKMLELEKKSTYRNLGVNVGMLGDEVRAQTFRERYKSEDIVGLGQFNFGSHYSNPGIIFQFMMRVSPFIEDYIKFFSGLDSPDRMFHSIEESWSISKTDPNDVRELIPEFFTVPDILINRDGFCYGKREETKDEVNNVLLPYWAKQSPYRFVELQREALESDCVSREIDKWINLIFGYQQQGKEAEKVCNVFPKLSYEAEAILSKLSGPQKESFMMQAYHWGQTPMQLLGKKHKERLVKDPNLGCSLLDKNALIKCTQRTLNKSIGIHRHKSIIKIFTSEQSHKGIIFSLVTLDGRYMDFVVNFAEPGRNPTASPQLLCSSVTQYQNHYFDDGAVNLSPLVGAHFPVVLVKKHGAPYLVQGGYLGGAMLFTEIGQSRFSFLKAHKDSVTCIEVDKEEKCGISGSASGEVVLYEIAGDMSWTARRQMCNHNGAVTHIHVSSGMFLFCTAARDGVVNLYSYSGCLVRKFVNPAASPVRYVVFLSNCRLC